MNGYVAHTIVISLPRDAALDSIKLPIVGGTEIGAPMFRWADEWPVDLKLRAHDPRGPDCEAKRWPYFAATKGETEMYGEKVPYEVTVKAKITERKWAWTRLLVLVSFRYET